MGAFMTPSLRNVGRTGPYMHDGSIDTLWDVIDFYSQGGGQRQHLGVRDDRLANLDLTEDEIDAIEAFLLTLDGTVPDHLDLPSAAEAACLD